MRASLGRPTGARRPPSRAARYVRRTPRAWLGLGLVALVLLAAVFANILAPGGPETSDFSMVLAPPSPAHPFGTDDLGRDLFARVLFGARIAIAVAAITVGGSLVIGTAAGLLAGYLGGWTESIVMRLMDVILAIPSILLALVITSVLGPGLLNAMLAISLVNIPVFARVARAQTLVVRELAYVEAGLALGMNLRRVLLKHILPNIAGPLTVQASVLTATAILTEAALSFLGVGAQPPSPSWGAMLSVGKGYMDQAPWIAIFPGLAIFLTVLGVNLAGDALRDYLDPRVARS